MLRTIEEWNHDASEGLLIEPIYNVGKPTTTIACPNVIDIGDGRNRMCGAHLWDTPFFTKDSPPRRKIRCDTCGWEGVRVIARGVGEIRMRKPERSVSQTYRLSRAEIFSAITVLIAYLGYSKSNDDEWRKAVQEARIECQRSVEKLRDEFLQSIRELRERKR